MTGPDHATGGTPVAQMHRLPRWEAQMLMNFRLWCDGPEGQQDVWNEYRCALPYPEARCACRHLEMLILEIGRHAHRPLVRHQVGCACVGSDEAVFLNLLRTASKGNRRDASLIATLLVGATHAHDVAVLADQVGSCARRLAGSNVQPDAQTPTRPHGATLH